MRSYPIYIKAKSDKKSFGLSESGSLEVLVGSSAKNSYTLANIDIFRRVNPNGCIEFELKVDGHSIKTLIFENNGGRAGDILGEISDLEGF